MHVELLLFFYILRISSFLSTLSFLYIYIYSYPGAQPCDPGFSFTMWTLGQVSPMISLDSPNAFEWLRQMETERSLSYIRVSVCTCVQVWYSVSSFWYCMTVVNEFHCHLAGSHVSNLPWENTNLLGNRERLAAGSASSCTKPCLNKIQGLTMIMKWLLFPFPDQDSLFVFCFQGPIEPGLRRFY